MAGSPDIARRQQKLYMFTTTAGIGLTVWYFSHHIGWTVIAMVAAADVVLSRRKRAEAS